MKVSRSNYKFPVLIDPIIWSYPEYTEKNLQIRVVDLLQSNSVYSKLSEMYQYVRIDAVALKCIPQPINGSYPPTGWAYMIGNEYMEPQYSALPRLPGSKLINGYKTTTLYFRRKGRQEDFGWYNNTSAPASNFSIRIRFSSEPAEAQMIMQIKVFLTFSMLIETPSNLKVEEKADVYKVQETQVKVEATKINPEVITHILEETQSFNDETSKLDISAITSNSYSSADYRKMYEQANTIEALQNLQKQIQSDKNIKKKGLVAKCATKIKEIMNKQKQQREQLLDEDIEDIKQQQPLPQQTQQQQQKDYTKEIEQAAFDYKIDTLKKQAMVDTDILSLLGHKGEKPKSIEKQVTLMQKTLAQYKKRKNAVPNVILQAEKVIAELQQKLADELLAS